MPAVNKSYPNYTKRELSKEIHSFSNLTVIGINWFRLKGFSTEERCILEALCYEQYEEATIATLSSTQLQSKTLSCLASSPVISCWLCAVHGNQKFRLKPHFRIDLTTFETWIIP